MARVLVVDDDEPIRGIVRLLLEENQHTVEEASNGEAALATLRAATNRYVVLLDLIMPEMDGVAVLDAVCADPDLRGRHAFLVISAGGTSDRERAAPLLESLHGQFVAKPFDIEFLLRVISEAAASLGSS